MLMSHPKTLFVRFASRHHALVRYGAVVLAKQRMTKNECLKQLSIWASNLIWPRKAPLKEAFVAIVLGHHKLANFSIRRSEERRVGKVWWSRWAGYRHKVQT